MEHGDKQVNAAELRELRACGIQLGQIPDRARRLVLVARVYEAEQRRNGARVEDRLPGFISAPRNHPQCARASEARRRARAVRHEADQVWQRAMCDGSLLRLDVLARQLSQHVRRALALQFRSVPRVGEKPHE